ncbi:MAG: hypothetical protein Q8L68_04545 [Methylococcales bacterium]|nr:hypothetical protein [Methylococcales bacterium]
MARGNRTNHLKKWMRWDDWESWRLKEWFPFREKFEEFETNDLPHMKADIAWLKWIMVGVLVAIVGSAIAVIIAG